MSDITQMLEAAGRGDPQSAEALLPVVYEELRRLASARMAHEPAGHTLQPTALVHEAWLRLVSGGDKNWDHRGHFFAAAAEAMRRILVERARRKQRIRHGGELERVPLSEIEIPGGADDRRLLEVHEALDALAAEDEQQAQVVKLRFFVGLGNAEIARLMGLSEKSVQRYWNHAKAWLYQNIKSG